MTIQQFIDALNQKFSTTGYRFAVERELKPAIPGVRSQRYARIVQTDGPAHRSVYCFVDAEGNIYKAAGWKSPAKGVRSTLATVDLNNVDPYGSWLYANKGGR